MKDLKTRRHSIIFIFLLLACGESEQQVEKYYVDLLRTRKPVLDTILRIVEREYISKDLYVNSPRIKFITGKIPYQKSFIICDTIISKYMSENYIAFINFERNGTCSTERKFDLVIFEVAAKQSDYSFSFQYEYCTLDASDIYEDTNVKYISVDSTWSVVVDKH